MEQNLTNGRLAEKVFEAKLALLDDPATDDATLQGVITPEDRAMIRERMKDADRRYAEVTKTNWNMLSEITEKSNRGFEESPMDVIGNWLGMVSDDERRDRMFARSDRDDAEMTQRLKQRHKELDDASAAAILWSDRYYRLPKLADGSDECIVSNPLAELNLDEPMVHQKTSPRVWKAMKVGSVLGMLAYLATR